MEERRDASRPALWGHPDFILISLFGISAGEEWRLNTEAILEVASLHDSQRPRARRRVVARQAAPEVRALHQRVAFVGDQSPEDDGLISSAFVCNVSGCFRCTHHVSSEELKQ